MSLPATTGRGVPHYALYGEMARRAEPGFVHIESLSLRSAQHGWQIPPHLHEGLAQAFWVAEGEGRAQLDRVQQVFAAPALLVVPAAAAHSFTFRPGSEGWVLTLATEFIAGLAAAEAASAFSRPLVRTMTPAEAEVHALERLFARIGRELEWGATGMAQAMAALVQLLMVTIARLSPAATAPPAAGEAIWQAFRAQVEQHFRRCHSVGEMAASLPVTRGRLDAICRRHGGRTAQQVIHDRLVLEAQRSLIYTGLGVAAIAYDLGFADPAYFSRFFLRETHEAPGAFRRRHREGGRDGISGTN
jgi:AraC family transcriptional activator of pobA